MSVYLTEAPVDPYCDEPLRYRLENDGFVLYSVRTAATRKGETTPAATPIPPGLTPKRTRSRCMCRRCRLLKTRIERGPAIVNGPADDSNQQEMAGEISRAGENMTRQERDRLLATYRDGLLEDTLPFWINHCVDRRHGGFMICLDRDGSILDTDKGMWQQCRFTWLLSTLYNTVEPREEWLELARHGIEFIRRHGFDHDGRMFFQVTREGRPVRKRRYVFTETFACIALAAFAKATGDEQAAREARGLFRLVMDHADTPGKIPPKIDPETRPCKGMGLPMILLITAQVLRETIGDSLAEDRIDRSIREIRRDFVKPELEAVLETVGPKGEVLDHFDGRLLNPGHAIEAAWFILAEAEHRGGDADLVELGTTMLDWMWRRGWDDEYGGMLYFRDLYDRPVQEYWHDMKFWWPQNEAIIATLLAYHLTGKERYAEWHRLAHDWAYRHFPDPQFGEWYGYLHREGRISVPLKGNLWKGPFHLPRMQLVCWKILERMQP